MTPLPKLTQVRADSTRATLIRDHSACNPCEIVITVRDRDPNDTRPKFTAWPKSQLSDPGENVAWARSGGSGPQPCARSHALLPSDLHLRYWASYESQGWDRLEIAAVPGGPMHDSIKAAAVGYAEGHLQVSVLRRTTRRVHGRYATYLSSPVIVPLPLDGNRITGTGPLRRPPHDRPEGYGTTGQTTGRTSSTPQGTTPHLNSWDGFRSRSIL